MPSHSLMSSSGHLQAATSTTPVGGPGGGGPGLHASFVSMEPHPASLGGGGEMHIKQEISAGQLVFFFSIEFTLGMCTFEALGFFSIEFTLGISRLKP